MTSEKPTPEDLKLVGRVLPGNASLTNLTDFRCSHDDLAALLAEARKEAYREGWNDREADFLAGAARVLPVQGEEEGGSADEWKPTHRHLKSGGFYQVLHRGQDITNHRGDKGVEVVIYRGAGGHIWVREASEFDDGRFEALPAPHQGGQTEEGKSHG